MMDARSQYSSYASQPRRAVDGLVTGHELPAAALGTDRCVNLPGLSGSVAEMVAALGRVAGPEAVRHIRWQPDPAIERIVASWPAAWASRTASGPKVLDTASSVTSFTARCAPAQAAAMRARTVWRLS